MLGYSPLSVLSAFGIVILSSWAQPHGVVSAVTDALSSKGRPVTVTARRQPVTDRISLQNSARRGKVQCGASPA